MAGEGRNGRRGNGTPETADQRRRSEGVEEQGHDCGDDGSQSMLWRLEAKTARSIL